MYTPIPSVILPAEEKGNFIAQMQIKITKGYRREAVERYKYIATYVAIFPVFGEERASKKGTELLAVAMARLLGIREAAPRPHRSSGMLSSQAFF